MESSALLLGHHGRSQGDSWPRYRCPVHPDFLLALIVEEDEILREVLLQCQPVPVGVTRLTLSWR